MEFFLLIITFVIVLVGIAYIYGKSVAKKTINYILIIPIGIGFFLLLVFLFNKIFGWFSNYFSALIRDTNWIFVGIGLIVIIFVVVYALDKEKKEELREEAEIKKRVKEQEKKRLQEEKKEEKKRLQEEKRLPREERKTEKEASGSDLISRLKRLKKMYNDGNLNKAEFEKAKNKLLK